MDNEKKIPKVKLGNQWLPAHKVWDVVESINTATDLIEKYNETRPHLSSPATREVVTTVRTRIRDMQMSTGSAKSLEEAAAEAAAMDVELTSAESGPRGSNTVTPTNKRALTPEEEVMADSARQLLNAMPLEDALRMIEQDYGEAMPIHELLKLVGEEVYRDALVREAKEFEANMITPDQIAFLWNESGIARPSGGLWTEQEIRQLTA